MNFFTKSFSDDDMAHNRQTDTLTIREIEYTIRIADKDSDFHELDNLLRAELTRFEDTRKVSEKPENPIQKFLRTNIERSVIIRDNTKVYFLNYQEKGSLTIRFKLLVISRYLNYGTIRQAIDYLVKDTIADYFEELLERHLPVSITVSADDNELYEVPVKLPLQKQQFEKRERTLNWPLILASSALLIVLVMSVLIFFRFSPATRQPETKTDENYKDKYYELIIDKQTREILDLQQEKMEILERKKAEADTSLPGAQQ